MARYKSALTDGSDPLYSPHTRTVKGRYRYWSPSKVAIEAGHPRGNVCLPGEIGDGRDEERAREARRLTIEMLKLIGAEEEGPPAGTWAWLIHRYRTDRYSPIREQKPNTRESEMWMLAKWDAAIGHFEIEDLTFEEVCKARDTMRQGGRSQSYISRLFSCLRRVAKYGTQIRAQGIADVYVTLRQMRFPKGARRSTVATAAQVRAIIDAADAAGQFAFATGILIQWCFALRAVDVRGQWFEIDEQEAQKGGIVRRSDVTRGGGTHVVWSRWQDGLTWEMVEPDLAGFSKVPSKTQKSLADPIRFPLEHVPELRARLSLLANAGRMGPVITSERTGEPYTKFGWSQAWARHRETAGVPEGVCAMDTRAGAISEAKSLGVDGLILRDAAGHMHASTTDGYARNRSDGVAKVVELRNRRKAG